MAAGGISKGTSLYLDVVRFIAAMAVFTGHLRHNGLGGHQFWRIALESQTAVAVFFVLSGYVIAYVVSTREQDALTYAEKRFSRLYSILLPALLLTAVCDGIGALHRPGLYVSPTNIPWNPSPWNYAVSALFLNSSWIFSRPGALFVPGTLIPIWSLSFEASYYAAAALMLFTRGGLRVALLLLLAAVMGPAAVVLAPLWGMGYLLYHYRARLRPAHPGVSAFLALGGLILCLAAYQLGDIRTGFDLPIIEPINFGGPHHQIGVMLGRYGGALGFAINLVGMDGLSVSIARILTPLEKPIRFAGMLTYPLYLFHRPLAFLLAAYSPFVVSSNTQLVWEVTGTLVLVIPLGMLAERTRPYYTALFQVVFGRQALRIGMSGQN